MLTKGRSGRRTASSPRNPERTRERLLDAAFREVHKSGFRGTDLDTILGTAGVTKGALYHHFESKEALGYALVDELLVEITHEKWLRPLENAEDPLAVLIEIVASTSLRSNDIGCGCPLNNLAQEMSPLDEGFRTRLARVFAHWQGGIAAALDAARKRGIVRSDVNPSEAATFLVATYEGYISLAKAAQDAAVLEMGKRSIAAYLQSLRASDRSVLVSA